MNTIEQLRSLFHYNVWANRRILGALVENECDKSRRIFSHLLDTEQEYFERLWGRDSTGHDFWPPRSIHECGILSGQIATRFETLLAGLSEESLDAIAAYRSSEGVAHENSWRELLTHVVIHSSTHRGNIMLKLRESGYPPPAIDYIVYLREKK